MVIRNIRKYAAVLAASVLVFVTGYASALAPLSVKELNDLCENYKSAPANDESVQCARYIKGFIDGVKSIRPSIVKAQSDEKKSSFTERAIATRIGSRTGHYVKKSEGPFCLGVNYSLKAIVKNVASEIRSAEPQKSALAAVDKALRKNYPCT